VQPCKRKNNSAGQLFLLAFGLTDRRILYTSAKAVMRDESFIAHEPVCYKQLRAQRQIFRAGQEAD
jgi:hypothetical protein